MTIPINKMERIFVLGAGFMGAGIAQVCAQSGFQVDLMDVAPDITKKALQEIRWSVEKLSAKGIIQESPDSVLDRISPVNDIYAAAQADWVIEAVIEDEELKCGLFQKLDRIIRPETLLATNTSSIPITRLAVHTQKPERVLGLHFFPPVPLVKLVEVVMGERTLPETFERGLSFVRALGKTPLSVRRDVPGFVMNRIFSAAFREAVNLVDQGIATVQDVDMGLRLSYGWTLGPFEIADLVGLDTVSRVGQALRSFGEPCLVPDSDLIERMVAEGHLGRKTGKGFYEYTPEGKRLPPEQ